MSDTIKRVTAANGLIRGFYARTKDMVNEAMKVHNCSPVVGAALGRLLTAASIFGTTLKNDGDLVTITVQGDGPIQGITVTGDNKARVKGFPYQNNVILPLKPNGKLDVGGAIGKGILTVIKDLGLKEPYVGKIELVSGEVAEDIASYLSISEQIPSAVSLGVLVDVDHTIKHAGGFIIELLPGCDDEIAKKLEENVQALPYITTFFDEGNTIEDLIERTVGCFGYEVTETIPVSYYCNCDRDRVTKALISVGKDDLVKILEEDGKADLHCHFCRKNYHFNENDLQALINQTM